MSIPERRKDDGPKILPLWLRFLLVFLVLWGPGRLEANPHAALTTYEGCKTCMPCHPGKAEEVHASAHYQLKGMTAAVPNLRGQPAGKINGINDFCTYPDINWLFEMVNLDKQTVVVGCATCHVGLGQKPAPDPTPEQLANIDCLVCHSDLYKRKAALVGGQPVLIPDPSVDLPAALAAIQKPTTATCLTRCHVNAGGGAALKQGDLDPAMVDPPRDLDVHLSSAGAGLSCLSCHKVQNHRIAGRGNDIRETDLDFKVDCTNCHGAQPHQTAKLNQHTARVHCTVCHIPSFARNLPTDILRDFSRIEADLAAKRYEPVRELAANVLPVYRWFNGLSYFYEFGRPIIFGANQSFILSEPLGHIADASAKIHPFKLHRSRLGYDLGLSRQIPVKSKVLWETGSIAQALRQGMQEVGWGNPDYGFANGFRYLSLHHQVAPKENALTCTDCHGNNQRLDFKALGYELWLTRNGTILCASCHHQKKADFDEVHAEHVDKRKIACQTCHRFRDPTVGLVNDQALELLFSR